MILISFAVLEKVPTCYCSFSYQLGLPMDRLSDAEYLKLRKAHLYTDLAHHLGLEYEITEEVVLPIFQQIIANCGKMYQPKAVTYDLGRCLLVAQYD